MTGRFNVVRLDSAPAPKIEMREICPKACRALWSAVLFEQWKAAWHDGPYNALRSRRDTDAARQWFQSADCATICGLLGLDVDYLRRKFAECLAQGGAPIPNFSRQIVRDAPVPAVAAGKRK